MVTKRLEIGKIEILADGQTQIRQDTVIEEDGVELIRTYHRSVLAPGDDVKGFDQRVQDVVAVVWTPQVIADFQAKKAAIGLPASSVPTTV